LDIITRSKNEAEKSRIEAVWGSLTWLANKKLTGTEGLTVGRCIIKKGMANPRHCHPNCDEVLYLLKGKLEHSVGDEKVIIEAGDTLVVPAGVTHNAVNIGDEDADMIVSYSSGQREFLLKK